MKRSSPGERLKTPWFLVSGWRLFAMLIVTTTLPMLLFVLLLVRQTSEVVHQQAADQNRIAARLTAQAVKAGDTLGYLAGRNPLALIRPSFAGSIYLVDHNGALIGSQSPAGGPPRFVGDTAQTRRMLTAQSGDFTGEDPVSGEKSLIHFEKIPGMEWRVVVSQAEERLNEPLYAIWSLIVQLALLSVAVMLTFGLSWLQTIRNYHRQRQEAGEHIRMILATASDAFISIDSEGRVLDWNRQAELIFGWSREEARGKIMAELILPPGHRAPHAEGLRRYIATGEGPILNRRIELTALRRDGREFPVELTVWPLREGGTVRFNAFLRDISERRKSQQLLVEKTTELARSQAELEQLELFAFVASHDLQEPLHKILAFSEMLGSSREGLDEKGRQYLDRMSAAALHLSGMIEQLRQFSRIGTHERSFGPVELDELAKEVFADLEPLVQEAGAEIRVGELPTIEADRPQMKQLFQNLVSNALKFRREGSRPLVEISGRHTEPGWVEVRVSDNGIGFEPRYLDRIFKPFQRLHPASRYKGSGIGLAICEKVAMRHGGKITAEGRPQEGSTFIVTLPVYQKGLP